MAGSARILVAEDEKRLNGMIRDYLESLGYEVVQAYDGVEAMKLFHREKPDMALVDVMMPLMDGIDVTRRIREIATIPLIILTAKAEEQDKLLGLDTGADDYMTKPFSMKELAARIRAQLRRVNMTVEESAENSAKVEYGGILLDSTSRRVEVDGRRVNLTSLQFDLLKGMMLSPGRVYTRMDILNLVQNDPYDGYERTVDVHIKNLRKLIEIDPKHPKYLQTVWGVGYKLELEEGGE